MGQDIWISLLAGGLITAALTYVVSILLKRYDKMDKIEERVNALEVGHRDVILVKETQDQMKHSIDTIIVLLTDLRIQVAAWKNKED